jgi:hypothetical protein
MKLNPRADCAPADSQELREFLWDARSRNPNAKELERVGIPALVMANGLSALNELEAASRLLATVLLAFLHARVAG